MPEQEIAAIRAENLTGRELRLARRTAQKHGLNPASDLDAVRLLRRSGIDPFDRANMLELVRTSAEDSGTKLPAAPGAHQAPPGPVVASADDRAREIRRIQRDIARRRRARMALLATRLLFFVLLPTALAGYYYFRVATPMYASHAEFVIQQADAASASPIGGLFSGTGFATSQDSIAVQSYLQSRDAMLRLDADLGFKAHFSQPQIDPIQRLDPAASNEQAYRLYKRHVKIGYDPTEGIVRMEVVAAHPATSKAFSEALISYAEERVDQLTQRLREDQMKGANESFADAERKMLAAQERVLVLQKQRGVLSADMEVSSQMSQISTFEM
ncbi:MAG: capsule biosynthesis protein, partial [Alphaproteobacteria bacterium HGW-Alphaproteobacteria-2]